jgi:hypothetical protein
MMDVWKQEDVERITRELEREVVRRLVDEGADLILETDLYSRVDGYVERNGRRTSVAEIKTRTEPFETFEALGSFLFDASKIRNLLEVARRERLKAVVFVMTVDERLFYAQITEMPKVEMRRARKNHHSREYIEKLVALIPLERFTEIQRRIHESRPDDIGWHGHRIQRPVNERYRSDEVSVYYQERLAIAIEDGGLPEWQARIQAERETSDWLLEKLKWSTDQIFKKL